MMYSPTALIGAGACRLKATLSSNKVDRLRSGPDASVGILIHRVLERTWGNPTVDVDSVFESEYEKVVDELKNDQERAHFADLASTRSLMEWSGLRAWIRARSMRGKSLGRVKQSGRVPEKGLGAEQILESHKLRLRGRADRVRRLGPEELEVRDFKSGSTLDSEGLIKSDIAMQLKAYGLMLMESNPNAVIRLIVDDGEEREIEFDLLAREQAREELALLVGTLPAPGNAPAEELAVPGSSCYTCPYRHACSAYLAIAPSWWKSYPADVDRIPRDIWGTMTQYSKADSRVSVRLTDFADRRIRVDGLSDRHGITADDVGQTLYFFGLEATGPNRDFDGRPFHPRSFHERPRDRLERMAWTVGAFRKPRT